MKFTGRVEFEWRNRQIGAGQCLCIPGEHLLYLGFAYPFGDSGISYRWGVYGDVLDGVASTPEEAKAALLKALGIVVEWQAESEEVE